MTAPNKTLLTVDIVARRRGTGEVLFIRRRNDPFKGQLALPGGFFDPGSDTDLRHAAVRELAEETGVKVRQDSLTLIGEYSRFGRDPRGPVVSIAFGVELPRDAEAEAGDDAAEVLWIPARTFREDMAFDHFHILRDALAMEAC